MHRPHVTRLYPSPEDPGAPDELAAGDPHPPEDDLAAPEDDPYDATTVAPGARQGDAYRAQVVAARVEALLSARVPQDLDLGLLSDAARLVVMDYWRQGRAWAPLALDAELRPLADTLGCVIEQHYRPVGLPGPRIGLRLIPRPRT